jgi:PelA/Pel-15E family pectate lyase
LKIADTIVSFQIPNGGWSKNLDMTQPARVLGEFYATDDLNRYPDAKDYDAPHDPHWNYVGTLDNDATNTELTFLRRVITVLPADKAQRYRASYLRGIDYLLQSQFPNGGWPQVWPLQGGYHDAITFNDDAVTESLESLKPVADGEVTFVPVTTRKLAAVAFARGLQCVLATQVTAQGKKTVWAQQNDPLTLEPVSARNYEMPALASGESAPVLEFLMEQSKPSPAIREAVEAGVAWFKATAIYGYTWGGTRAEGRHLSKADGAGPIWARYYSLTTDTPIFGDRDKTIHDDVSEISLERRNGYAWYNGNGVEVLAQYKNWLALRKQAMGTGH